MSLQIKQLFHPQYSGDYLDFLKWRCVFEGGDRFIEKYLIKLSARETNADFEARKRITYVPAHAKAAVIDVRNAIFQRMADIIRSGGSDTYKASVRGEGRGVDLQGNSMNAFIGAFVLPELLIMSRVGVYVDRPPIPERSTLRDEQPQPYLYFYPAEDIVGWNFNEINELTSVLLRDRFFQNDEDTGLVTTSEERFRLLQLTTEGVRVRFFREEVETKGAKPVTIELQEEETLLNLKRIPFTLPSISQSLLTDIANHQIALLNMASGDVNYGIKANFPFYTEQYDPVNRMAQTLQGDNAGTSKEANTAQTQSINVGVSQGRAYPRGSERPGFIHPSSEPLLASIEKQQQIRDEIRQLINLALSNIKPVRASAESKQIDNQGLEAGLSYIGLVLEQAEREIAKIWEDYERKGEIAHVKYPDNYQLRTDKDRRTEAKELDELKKSTPSLTYKKELCKQIAHVTMGTKVSLETLETINEEIDNAAVVETDSETVRNDHEAGFVSTKTASQIRGYGPTEFEQAKIDHAERLARINMAQTNPAARGVPDADGDVNSGKVERQAANMLDTKETTEDPTRGEGQ